MTQKIKIEVDVIQGAIKRVEIPDGLDHIEAIKIFMGIATRMIQDIKVKKVEPKNGNIITPNNKIVKPILKQV